MSDSDSIDRAAHERLLEWGGNKLLRQMIRLFLENLDERMGLVATGIQEGEAHKVEHATHSLKSSASNVGAVRVRDLCAEMEELAARGDLAGAAKLHEALKNARSEAEARLLTLEEGIPE